MLDHGSEDSAALDAEPAVADFAFAWDQDVIDAAVYQRRAKSTAVLDAARHLREAIILCLLPAGGKLPTEPELAERLGVGVVTMHSALAMLRAEGFITTTRGRNGGSWVASNDEILQASMRTTTFSVQELREHSDILIGLESQAMGLAALRATAAERAEIVDIASYPRDLLSPHQRQMHSNVFHLRIAHAAHNGELLGTIRRYRAHLQELRAVAAGHIVFCTNSANHQPGIARAIADGDADRARNLCHRFLAECWDCNFRVIEAPNTVERRDIDLFGPLDARRHLAAD